MFYLCLYLFLYLYKYIYCIFEISEFIQMLCICTIYTNTNAMYLYKCYVFVQSIQIQCMLCAYFKVSVFIQMLCISTIYTKVVFTMCLCPLFRVHFSDFLNSFLFQHEPGISVRPRARKNLKLRCFYSQLRFPL